MAVSVTPASPRAGQNVTVAGSGLTASTPYLVTIQAAGVSWIGQFKVTTDGAGAFSVVTPLPATPYTGITWTVNVYANDPVAESSTTTLSLNIANATVASTTTFTAGPPSS